MGVAVTRYIKNIIIITITFPYSTCISSFIGSNILTFLFCFFVLYKNYIRGNSNEKS